MIRFEDGFKILDNSFASFTVVIFPNGDSKTAFEKLIPAADCCEDEIGIEEHERISKELIKKYGKMQITQVTASGFYKMRFCLFPYEK